MEDSPNDNGESAPNGQVSSQSEDENLHEKEYNFKWYSFLFMLFSIALYLGDIISDFCVAVNLYLSGQELFFGLAIAFILVPAVITVFFSFMWYEESRTMEEAPPFSPNGWLFRKMLHFVLLGPIVRTADAIRYGVKLRRAQTRVKRKDGQETVEEMDEVQMYGQWMVYEAADNGYLKLVESFLEGVPQLLLQLYIFSTQDYEDSFVRGLIRKVSMCISLVSLAFSLTGLQRSVRQSQQDAFDLSLAASVVLFLWYLFVVTSRILAVGLFISLHPAWTAAVLAVHWILAVVWLTKKGTEFFYPKNNSLKEATENLPASVAHSDTSEGKPPTPDYRKYLEYLFRCVLGVVLLFAYVNAVDGDTRKRYWIFYAALFVEDVVFIGIWYAFASVNSFYRLLALLTVLLSFLVGIAFMLLYYGCFHPNPEVRIWCKGQKERVRRRSGGGDRRFTDSHSRPSSKSIATRHESVLLESVNKDQEQ